MLGYLPAGPLCAVAARGHHRRARGRLRMGARRAALAAGEAPPHAIAMHGAPAWPPDFKAASYANAAAPKGGQLVQGVLGTFDSLNPFIVKGLPAANIRSYVVESLLARGYDEPFTLYGLLAEGVETDVARSFVTFTLNPAARFSDGKPVTPDDVIFSWQLLRDHGRPNYQIYYAKVVKAEALDARRIRFDLAGADDRELPLIIGLMPIFARHAVKVATFEDTTFEPLIGSGPYTISAVRPGESVTFTRDTNYGARDLADQSRPVEFRHHPPRLSTATPIPISKLSRRAFTICARRPIPAAGKRLTIFRRCAKARS